MDLGKFTIETDERLFRHEYKYLVSAAQIPVLKSRIAHLMKPDSNAGEDGMYRIRSLYFDDMRNRCFFENESGVDRRAKYRIRIYNASDARIRLELKEGLRGKKHKTSDPLSRELAEQLIAGRYLPQAQIQSAPDDGPAARPYKVLPGLCADIMINRMRPAVIVEYDRIPYVYRYGNVRVTFDLNISSSSDYGNFFCERIAKRPIMQTGMHLMEVKFDEFLPDVIYRALQLGTLQQTTFSKYYLCRIHSRP